MLFHIPIQPLYIWEEWRVQCCHLHRAPKNHTNSYSCEKFSQNISSLHFKQLSLCNNESMNEWPMICTFHNLFLFPQCLILQLGGISTEFKNHQAPICQFPGSPHTSRSSPWRFSTWKLCRWPGTAANQTPPEHRWSGRHVAGWKSQGESGEMRPGKGKHARNEGPCNRIPSKNGGGMARLICSYLFRIFLYIGNKANVDPENRGRLWLCFQNEFSSVWLSGQNLEPTWPIVIFVRMVLLDRVSSSPTQPSETLSAELNWVFLNMTCLVLWFLVLSHIPKTGSFQLWLH